MITRNRFDGNITRKQLNEHFYKEYLPLLKKVSEAESTIVFGDGNSIDNLIKKSLKTIGYQILKHQYGYNEAMPINQIDARTAQLTEIAARNLINIEENEIIENKAKRLEDLEVFVHVKRKAIISKKFGLEM